MKNLYSLVIKMWKIVLLFILILLTFSYAMFQGGFVSWFLFYSFLPFAVYGVALFFYPMKVLNVTRVLEKTHYQAGEPVKIKINVKRSNPFPLFYLLIEDDIPDSSNQTHHSSYERILFYPGFKKEFSYEYTMDKLPRGEYFFHSITLRIGDPLGLFEREKKIATKEKIIVYPSYSELPNSFFESQYNQGLMASKNRKVLDTSMVVGVRDYQPGDRFSWINWKASAKRNEMMTKEFERGQSNDLFVVMDCNPTKQFEEIVSFTASLLHTVLKKGTRTGLLTFSKEQVWFPIREGEQHLQQLFYYLAKIEAKSSSPVEKILEMDRLSIQQSVSLIVITSKLTKSLIEKVSFIGPRSTTNMIFIIKGEQEPLTKIEQSLIYRAELSGVRVVLIHEDSFAVALKEVNSDD
jgi:uncharacterized protein (DUF58 family)